MQRHVIPALVLGGFFARARGLLGREHLLASGGAVLAPCSAIHTCGMRGAIDVVFLDSNAVVIDIARSVAPFRFCRSAAPGTVMTLELASGDAARRNLCRGDLVIFEERGVIQ